MKKNASKSLKVILLLALTVILVFMLCACNGNKDNTPSNSDDNQSQNTPSNPDDDQSQNTPSNPDDDQSQTKPNPPVEVLPTAGDVVAARKAVADASKQNYDFILNLSGTVSLGAYSGTANGKYDGKYRYDKDTNELKFKRETSGILLYDSIEYIYNSGSSKIKLVADDKNVVKKSSVVLQDEEELTLINKPFEGIIDSLKAENITNIRKLSAGNYKYVANIELSSSNTIVQKAISSLAKQGTSLDMHDVKFTNPVNGVELYFNLSDGKLTGFSMSMDVTVPVKGADVVISLTYSQSENNAGIAIPSSAGLIVERAAVESEMDTISAAILALKNSDAYSLDLEAKNDFDAGWNSRAIVDKYIARMYKNTTDGRVDFNHSYEYKAHTEEEGAETFKYTVANIKDGSVHRVSRKGKNVIEALDGVTANTQFDYLISAANISVDKIDCIRKESANGSTKYYIYMNKEQTMSVQSIIADIINSNDAEGVIPVNNYFNTQSNTVRDSEMVIEMKNGKIVAIDVATKIRYNPVGGDYMEEQITLTNSISLVVNDKLSQAKEYEAPKSTTTVLGSFGLNNAKFYIL